MYTSLACYFNKKEAPGLALGEPSGTPVSWLYQINLSISIALPALVTKIKRLIPLFLFSLAIR